MSRCLQCHFPIALIEKGCMYDCMAVAMPWRSLHTGPTCCIRCIDIHMAAKSLLHILQVIVSGTVYQQLHQFGVQSLRLHCFFIWCISMHVTRSFVGHVFGGPTPVLVQQIDVVQSTATVSEI